MCTYEGREKWKDGNILETKTGKTEPPELRSQNENKHLSVGLPQAPQNIKNVFTCPLLSYPAFVSHEPAPALYLRKIVLSVPTLSLWPHLKIVILTTNH